MTSEKDKPPKYDVLEEVVLAFYTLEHLYVELQNQRQYTIADTVFKQIEVYRPWFHAKLARTLRDSLAGMALGEARYTGSSNYSGKYRLTGFDKKNLRSGSRDTIYTNLARYSLEDIRSLQRVFECDGWGNAYGGDPWAEIVRRVFQYGKVPDVIYCDTIFHVVHNNGCCFNKGLLVYAKDQDDMQELLDTKFSGSVFELEKSGYEETNWVLPMPVYHYWLRARQVKQLKNHDLLMQGQFEKGSKLQLHQIDWADTNGLILDEEEDEDENCDCEDCTALCSEFCVSKW